MLSKSVINSILSIVSFCEFTTFLVGSDSPVKDDCVTYKSFASIILLSAGIISPADNTIISPTATSFNGTFISLLFLITVVFVSTKLFNFSAALFER